MARLRLALPLLGDVAVLCRCYPRPRVRLWSGGTMLAIMPARNTARWIRVTAEKSSNLKVAWYMAFRRGGTRKACQLEDLGMGSQHR